jgi:hypothetical protein
MIKLVLAHLPVQYDVEKSFVIELTTNYSLDEQLMYFANKIRG